MNGNIEQVWGSMTWLIASLAGGEFVLRAFEIDGGAVTEVDLDVG